MNYASDEKLRLLRWLLPQIEGEEIIAAELPFRDVGRKADMAILSPTRLHVIEVKGSRDNLDKLEAQAQDYLVAFLAVDLALATRYVGPGRSILPASVGILELSEEGIIRRRMPAIRKVLTKEGALNWLHAKDLQSLLGHKYRGLDIVSLRELAKDKLDAKTLTSAASAVAYRRSKDRYDAFLAERAELLTLDDVAVLQQPTRIR